MNINTQIATREIVIEIDGVAYNVAPKTISVMKSIKNIETKIVNDGGLQYELWLETLKILLGENAVNELFPDIENANIDRIENIFYGVSYAFNANERDIMAARESEKISKATEQLDTVTEKIKNAADSISTIANCAGVIANDKHNE